MSRVIAKADSSIIEFCVCGRRWPCGVVHWDATPVPVPADVLARLIGFIQRGPHAEVVADVDRVETLLAPFVRGMGAGLS